MRHSLLNVHDALLAQSLKLPALVDSAARKEHAFTGAMLQWLAETETAMQKNGLPQCARLAGLRGKLIAEGMSSEAGRRKRQLALAAATVDDAQHTLLGVLEPIEAKLHETRETVRQLLGVAYQANMIDPRADFNSMLQQLWAAFSAHEQLKGAVARILSMVNRADALRIMAEEIELVALQPH